MRLIITDTRHLNFKKELLWLGLFTLVTLTIWIIYSVYLIFVTPTVDEDVTSLLTPLNPELDSAVLTQLNERYVPAEDFIPAVVLPTPSSPSATRL